MNILKLSLLPVASVYGTYHDCMMDDKLHNLSEEDKAAKKDLYQNALAQCFGIAARGQPFVFEWGDGKRFDIGLACNELYTYTSLGYIAHRNFKDAKCEKKKREWRRVMQAGGAWRHYYDLCKQVGEDTKNGLPDEVAAGLNWDCLTGEPETFPLPQLCADVVQMIDAAIAHEMKTRVGDAEPEEY